MNFRNLQIAALDLPPKSLVIVAKNTGKLGLRLFNDLTLGELKSLTDLVHQLNSNDEFEMAIDVVDAWLNSGIVEKALSARYFIAFMSIDVGPYKDLELNKLNEKEIELYNKFFQTLKEYIEEECGEKVE